MLLKALRTIFITHRFDVRLVPKSLGKFGQSRITMEDGLAHLRSRDFRPKTVIDVGAGNGTTPLLNVFPDAHYLWIEPLQEFESQLEALRPKYKGDIFIAAAGPAAGKEQIALGNNLLNSSLKSVGEDTTPQSREIDVVALDDLKDKIALDDDVLLKVDVQGGELDVLEGAREILPKMDVILLEVSFFRFFDGIPIFDEVVAYMKDHGFVVYDIVAGNTRPLDNALGQKDLIFVRTDGRFRQSDKWS